MVPGRTERPASISIYCGALRGEKNWYSGVKIRYPYNAGGDGAGSWETETNWQFVQPCDARHCCFYNVV
jgi:hypothetical protein